MSSDTGNLTDSTVKADTLSGTLIDGKYEVTEKLSHGGIGIVYKGRHTLIDRTVAIKVLHSHLVENDEWLKRFQHEAQIASKISHPHAILIYDFGVFRGLPYLIMEFADGITLKDKVKRDGPLPLKDVCTIFEQACAALLNAHQLGIVHRDLKPDNIMISKRGDDPIWVEVLDFGIAKIVQGDKPASMNDLTQTGTFYGTPKYASPEQVLGKELDVRSDIYSLGVMLYEMVSGEVPFDAPSIMAMLLKQMNEVPQPLRKVRPDLRIPRALEDLVMKCLQKDPKDRYQSIDQLSAQLRAIRESLGEPSRVRVGNSPVAFIIAFLLVVGAAVGSAWSFGWLSFGNKNETVVAKEVVQTPSVQPVTPAPQAEAPPVPPVTETGNESWAIKGLASLVMRPLASGMPELGSAEQESPPSREAQLEELAALSAPEESTAPSPDVPSAPEAAMESEATEPTSPAVEETPKALEMVAPVVEHKPLDGRQLFEEGDKLLQQGRYAEAIVKLEKSVEIKPGSMRARLALGVSYLKLGRKNEAYKQFQAARNLDNGFAPVHFNLACYYAVVGQREAALDSLETMVHLNPRSRSWIRREADLAPLRGDPRFEALLN